MNHMTRHVLAAAAVLCAAFSPALAQSFSSGSTGAQGPFPPAAFSGSYTRLLVDLKTGIVTASGSSGSVVSTAALTGGAASGDAFPTGELHFTTFNLPNDVELRFVPNSMNTPVTIRATGDVSLFGRIYVNGGAGSPSSGSGISPGGKGGPGGGNGGNGGVQASTGRAPIPGGPGLGKNGGVPAALELDKANLAAWGGGGAFPHANPAIVPFVGGSGGGGGRGTANLSNTIPASGGGGGGGGGAILIASSTKIIGGVIGGGCSGVCPGNIYADGGDGGQADSSAGDASSGGGGAGGAIRLMANQIQTNGALYARGGSGAGGNAGAAGYIRLEAFDLSYTGSAIPPGTSAAPGAVRPSNLPVLRISSVGGASVADGAGDVTIPAGSSAPANPMAVVVTGTNIPNGTTITVSLKTAQGAESTASAAINNGTASVNLTVPSGVSYLQASSAAFTITAELRRELPLFNGEKILTASVEFDGARPHAYFFTEAGHRISSEQLFGQE